LPARAAGATLWGLTVFSGDAAAPAHGRSGFFVPGGPAISVISLAPLVWPAISS
jgi:hypothetical protein